MPAIVAFGRKWLVGSDDFVLPALVDLTVKLCWLIGAVIVFIRNDPHFGCPDGDHFKIYLYGLVALLLILILTDGLVAKNSMSGGILDEGARVRVVPFIYIRCFLEICDILWNILGTAWAYGDPFMLGCPEEPEALTFMKRFTVCNWISTLVMFFFFVALWDPLGYDVPPQGNEHKKVMDPLSLATYYNENSVGGGTLPHTERAQYWTTKLKKLTCFCCNSSKDDNVLGAFEEAGRIISFICRESNLVTTDVLAGLLALYVKTQKEEEARKEAIRKRNRLIQAGGGGDGPVACVCQNNIIYPITTQPKVSHQESPDVLASKNEIVMLDYYLRFIHGCYGWKTFLAKNIKKRGFPRLWSSLECCACFRSGRDEDGIRIKGDNCCLLSTAALRQTARVDPRDIVYISFDNGYFEPPFYVAVDHCTKSLVVAIRGTLNNKDLLTNLTSFPIPLEIPGLPLHFKAHHGMMMTARNVKAKLEKDQVLERLFDKYPDYKLVLLGQSSGGAVAAVLGLMMFYDYPNLQVYCYSPPGNVLNKDAAEFSKSFVTSVTYGDDVMARINIQSISRFKTRLVYAIQSCGTPKYRLILGYRKLLKRGGPLPKFEYFEQVPEMIVAVEEDPHEYNKEFSSASISNASGRLSLSETNNNVYNRSSHHEHNPFHTQMFVPGRILHVTQRESWMELPEAGPRWQLKWAEKKEFQDIVVSPRMIADHWYHRMEKGLHEFVIANCREAFNALHHNRQRGVEDIGNSAEGAARSELSS